MRKRYDLHCSFLEYQQDAWHPRLQCYFHAYLASQESISTIDKRKSVQIQWQTRLSNIKLFPFSIQTFVQKPKLTVLSRNRSARYWTPWSPICWSEMFNSVSAFHEIIASIREYQTKHKWPTLLFRSSAAVPMSAQRLQFDVKFTLRSVCFSRVNLTRILNLRN